LNKELQHIVAHLRFPFSLFLLPIYLFALSQCKINDAVQTISLFFILHLMVYPSSNGYNSYMDQDEGSIGGLKTPPKIPASLIKVVNAMDILAVFLSYLLLNGAVALMIFIYIIISRAYSYRGIRIKKYPIAGFLTVAFFQGAFIFVTVYWTSTDVYMLSETLIYGSIISFILMGAGYPLTQIYQHEQDEADGVTTISMKLGIKGTFLFSGLAFFLLGLSMVAYLLLYKQNLIEAILFLMILSPVVVYFSSWMFKAFKDSSQANFENTMKMNKIGAYSMNVFFIILLINSLFHVV
jgi:1,4-dihydroxy-2-naphthoate octaprenyltransferase